MPGTPYMPRKRKTINDKIAASIEKTEHPLAFIILQEAYKSIHQTGTLMAGSTNKEETNALSARLMSGFTNEELDTLGSSPAFIMALCGMLATSLKAYTDAL